MSSHPQPQDDVQALRRLKKVDFTVYRRGEAVFRLESRRQGHIRKVTQATYKEAIMSDDSITLTLVSTERMTFKMRDYIVYDNRPYFLNRLPDVGVDTAKHYTYEMTFEGAMFELGRIAFILRNAHGYDFYGTLPEFARLVVDNMNKANSWVEWTNQNHSYKAKFKKTVDITHGGVTKIIYMWGFGFNHDLEGMGELFIYTDGFPSVGGHAIHPEDFSTISDITITAAKHWTLNFPRQTTIPTEYPTPEGHMPDDEYAYEWCDAEDAEKEVFTQMITDFVNAATWSEVIGSYEHGVTATLVPNSIVEGEIPNPSVSFPSSPTDSNTVMQPISFQVTYTAWHEDTQYGGGVVTDSEWTETEHIFRKVTYIPVLNSSTVWHVEPVVPQSGTATVNDYPTESKLLAYDQHSCLAVLQDLANQWQDWEWRISDDVHYGFINGEMLVCGTIIMRQKSENYSFVHVLDWGKGGGLLHIKKKSEDEGNIPSRVYFYGGTQNLPQYYRNTRLCLPSYSKEGSYIEFAEINPCPFLLALDNQTCEEVKVFDDIYPACKPFVIKSTWGVSMAHVETITTTYGTATMHFLMLTIPKEDFFLINDKWKSFDEMQSPYPDYLEWLTLKQYVDTIDNRKRYVQYYVGKSKYQNGTDTPTPYIVFQTGDLAGFKLSIHKTYIDYKDSEGKNLVLLLNVVRNDNEEFHDADTNTPEADYTPNADVCCHQGDKFIVEGINMPVAYTYYSDGSDGDFSAENALWKVSMDYMCAKAENIGYDVEIARDYLVGKREAFRCFDGVQFGDITTDNAILRKRISSVELDLVDGYSYKIEITNHRKKNALAVLGSIVSRHNDN